MTSAFLFVTFEEPMLWVERAIFTMINQTIAPNEIIHIDNSHDGRYDFSSKLNFKEIVYLYIKPRKELSFTEALNYGMENAKSEIIFRADPDDLSSRKRIETVIAFFLKLPNTALVASRVYIINESGEIIDKSKIFNEISLNLLQKGNPMVHGSIAFRRSKILLLGGYNTVFEKTQDYELYTHLLKNKEEIGFINEPLYYLRIHQNSVSNNPKTSIIQARNSLFLKAHINKYLNGLITENQRINKIESNTADTVLEKLIKRKNYRNYVYAISINSKTYYLITHFSLRYLLIWLRGFVLSINPRVLHKYFYR